MNGAIQESYNLGWVLPIDKGDIRRPPRLFPVIEKFLEDKPLASNYWFFLGVWGPDENICVINQRWPCHNWNICPAMVFHAQL